MYVNNKNESVCRLLVKNRNENTNQLFAMNHLIKYFYDGNVEML